MKHSTGFPLTVIIHLLICFNSHAANLLVNHWTTPVSRTMMPSTQTALIGIACSDSQQQCVTVGFSNVTSPMTSLVYTSNDGGNTWSNPIQPAVSFDEPEYLFGVDCSTDGLYCTAVGTSTAGTNTNLPLSYRTTDGGNTWTSRTLLASPDSSTNNVLNDIACDTQGIHCAAVGLSVINDMYTPLVYTSTDGGNTWSTPRQPTLPPTATFGTLLGISCDNTAINCNAVGYAEVAKVNVPLIYRSMDGGNTWGNAIFPSPPAGGIDNVLHSVSCDGMGIKCSAVGNSRMTDRSLPMSYNSIDGGHTWSEPTLLTQPADAVHGGLNNIFCSADGLTCTAMGYYSPSVMFIPVSYSSHDGGNTWTSLTLLTTLPGSQFNILYDMTCDHNGEACIAVGTSLGANVLPIIYVNNNGNWNQVLTPLLPTVNQDLFALGP